jgi:hypothetical protein
MLNKEGLGPFSEASIGREIIQPRGDILAKGVLELGVLTAGALVFKRILQDMGLIDQGNQKGQ